MTGGIYLLLGSNKGNREHYLALSNDQLASLCGLIVRKSSIYETAAWGNTNQEKFLNQVIEIESILPPELLLNKLLEIEESLGRKRTEKWGPREIDLDILFYKNAIIDEPSLQIPHPAIPLRRFTLVPLVEISPNLIHPTLGKTCSQLLENCTDPLEVKKFL